MSPSPEAVPDREALSEIFEEVLSRRERGEALEWDALSARAGTHAEELRERLRLLRQFQDLSFLLEDEEEESADEPSGVTRFERIGRYEVGELLGEGGLSRVYLARDTVLGREVALKLLSPTAVPITEARQWMISEGRALAKLEHPSIVRVLDVGEHQGFAFIAMERVPGPSLSDVLDALRSESEEGLSAAAVEAGARLEGVASRARLVLQLARALECCHLRGIVHRDVKPGNVLLDAEGVPKLIDFGLSHRDEDERSLRITQRLAGTIAYFSPEQVDERRSGASPLSDQFSLGVLLYELLTLRHPFARGTHAGTMDAISRALPVAPHKLVPAIPEDLQRICLHALERVPGGRYPSLGALADDLEAFLEHRAISVRPPSALKLARLWLRRHRRATLTAGGGLLAAAALSFGAELWQRVAFARGVSADRGELASISSPAEFEALFRSIRGQWVRAGGHDAAALAGVVLPRVSPELAELWVEASAALHDEVAPLYARAEAHSQSHVREREWRRLEAHWGRALAEELYSAPPDHAHDDPIHALGEIELPPGGELYQYDPNAPPQFPVLLPVVGRTRLEQAFYRYTRTDARGLAIDSEFRVFLSQPRFRVEPVAISPEREQELVPVPRLVLVSDAGVRDSEEYVLEAFELSRRPVTWAEVSTVLGEGTINSIRRSLEYPVGDDPIPSFAPEAPAVVSWTHAQEFLNRTGGRLPTAAELHAALRDERVESPLEAGFRYEWVSANFGPDDRDWYHYAYKALHPELDDPETPASSWVVETRPDTRRRTVCFRIARSAGAR